ncbi:hypothetical protein GCK32_021190 [Trichostrongylus colubriformis]|uniref:Uncharacterized protein n=1 Tax=Trichostrongylus colubriformis TaxID=6319 RepID=A0AAN8G411_TRICO
MSFIPHKKQDIHHYIWTNFRVRVVSRRTAERRRMVFRSPSLRECFGDLACVCWSTGTGMDSHGYW